MTQRWRTKLFYLVGWALAFSFSGCDGSKSGGEDVGDGTNDGIGDGDGTDDVTDDGTDDGTNDDSPSCGNNRLDPGETCDPPGTCPTDCDDSDPCTIDQMTGSASTCDVSCTRVAITTCTGGDGCCPAGCTLATPDADCPFYVDATGGNDAHDGLTPETAWQSAARASEEPLAPGNRIAFKRGEVWHETFHVAWSGSEDAPIVITSYGDGMEPPLFVPTEAVTSWVAEANHIYSALLETEPMQVLADGERLRFAHYPNDGYLYVDQAENTSPAYVSSFLDNDLTRSAEEVIGSTVLLRGTPWQLYTGVVSDFSGQRITLESSFWGLTSFQSNVGYVLTNKLWMLDEPGEWFYDTAAQKLYVRLVDDGNPASHDIEISPKGVHGIDVDNASHIILDGLAVRHAGFSGIEIHGTDPVLIDGVFVRNCRVETSGMYGIRVNEPPQAAVVELDHNVIRASNYGGIMVSAALDEQQNVVVRGNRIEDTASDYPVVGGSSYGWGFGVGLYLYGGGMLAEENVVHSAGYSCSMLFGASHQMLRNHLERCCLIFDDGGGIYMGGTIYFEGNGHVVRGNTVVDSLGNAEGTPRFFTGQTTAGQGIYLDEHSYGLTVEDNTIVNADYGVQIHSTHDDLVRGNTVFASRRAGVYLSSSNQANVIEENVFFSAAGAPAVYESYGSEPTVYFASYDNNQYWHQEGLRPLWREIAGEVNEYTLDEWREETDFDESSADLATIYQVFPSFGQPTGASNLITNGGFDASTDGWFGWPADVNVARASECGLTGGCLSATREGGSGRAFVGSNTLTVVKGQGYVLRFSVRADSRLSLDGIIRGRDDPWSSLGVSQRITIGTAPIDYVWPFMAFWTDDDYPAPSVQGRFDILGGTDFAFFLDDVDVREADIILNDPADDAQILLNPTSTESAVDIGAAPWCDLDDNEVTGTLVVPAFSSNVLLGCMCNNDGACNNHETAESCSGDCP